MFFHRGRRQQFVVNRRFQFQYALAGTLYIGTIAVCLSLPFVPLLNTMRALLVGEPAYLIQLVDRQEKFAILTFVLCSAWLAAAWVLFSIRRSHRIAGPAYKLTKFMNGITRTSIGDRVALRKNDELQSVADSLNAMLDRLESRSTEPRRETTAPADQHAEKHPVG